MQILTALAEASTQRVEALRVDQVNGKLPEGTYIELVASLFSTLLPTAIMTVSFLGIGLVVIRETPDPMLAWLIVFGSVAAMARLAVLSLYRKRARADTLECADARRFE